MSIPARSGIVTLGVTDVARSVAFHEAHGRERCASSMNAAINIESAAAVDAALDEAVAGGGAIRID